MKEVAKNIKEYEFPLITGKDSYLDMVPSQSRVRIIKMAHKAFGDKGCGRSLLEFTEDMAKFWLMVREEFYRMIRAHGFTQVNEIDCETKKAFFLFTESGSFLGCSIPDEEGFRDFAYQSVQLLGSMDSAHYGAGVLRVCRYKDDLIKRTRMTDDGAFCADVEHFVTTSPINSIFVGDADSDKIRMLVQLIKATILDAGYFTQTSLV